MNRRRFLKYASATAAIVGGSAIGLNYYLRQSRSKVTPMTSTTVASQMATTTSPFTTPTQTVELASLNGRLFFDYNGNGVQDTGEPAVAGALVQLKDNTGMVVAETLTDSSGDYKLEDVKTGSYRLRVGVDHFSDKQFTYMCTSPDEFRAVTEDYHLSLQENVNMDIGLMEGFLTLPLSSETDFSIDRFYDWDPDPEKSLWWNGMSGNDPWNHPGIDYRAREGEYVVAAAPAIFEAQNTGHDVAGALYAYLTHPSLSSWTFYNHLSEVLVTPGAVKRGDKIAKTGSSGAAYPHLHFGSCKKIGDYVVWLEPYKTLFEIDDARSGYWAQKEHEEYDWIKVPLDENPYVGNSWTKLDDPQHAIPV